MFTSVYLLFIGKRKHFCEGALQVSLYLSLDRVVFHARAWLLQYKGDGITMTGLKSSTFSSWDRDEPFSWITRGHTPLK